MASGTASATARASTTARTRRGTKRRSRRGDEDGAKGLLVSSVLCVRKGMCTVHVKRAAFWVASASAMVMTAAEGDRDGGFTMLERRHCCCWHMRENKQIRVSRAFEVRRRSEAPLLYHPTFYVTVGNCNCCLARRTSPWDVNYVTDAKDPAAFAPLRIYYPSSLPGPETTEKGR